jgi:hypothetical protein
LLLFMVGATETAKGPEVAPDAIVRVIDVSLQELIVIGAPFSRTTLLPCVAPNPLPLNPLCEVTVIALVPLAPCTMLRPLGDAESV